MKKPLLKKILIVVVLILLVAICIFGWRECERNSCADIYPGVGNGAINHEGKSSDSSSSIPCSHDWVLMDSGTRYCTEVSYDYYECSNCYETKEIEQTPIGHDYEQVDAFIGNCQIKARISYRCSRCEDEKTEFFGYGSHNWYEIESSSLCGSEGYFERSCGTCGENESGTTLGLSHDLITKEALAPTCFNVGYEEYEECTRCTYTTREDIPATEHKDTKWVVTLTPTETTKGVREFSCGYCGHKDRVEMPESIYTDGLIYELDGVAYKVVGIDRKINPDATVIAIPKTYMGKHVLSIKNGAFKNDSKIDTLDLSQSLISYIPDECFYGSSALVKVKLSEKTTNVGVNAFNGCTALKEVDFSTGIEEIKEYAFFGSAIERVELPYEFIRIKSFAFGNCEKLTTVNIGNVTDKIGESVFKGCSSLESLTVPFVGSSQSDTNHTLGYFFGQRGDNTENLAQVVPSSLKYVAITYQVTVNENTFRNCESIEKIILPDVLEWNKNTNGYDFTGCDSLQFNVYANGKYIGTQENDYYLLIGPVSEGAVVAEINPNTCVINQSAFENNQEIVSITIPNSVNVICSYAFSGCANLKTVNMSSGVVYINGGAFKDCEKLESLTLSSNLESIGNGAFRNCTKLKTVTIPASVNFMGNCVFYNSGLTHAYLLVTTGWYIEGTGYILLPQAIDRIADPELLASRLVKNDKDGYWKRS